MKLINRYDHSSVDISLGEDRFGNASVYIGSKFVSLGEFRLGMYGRMVWAPNEDLVESIDEDDGETIYGRFLEDDEDRPSSFTEAQQIEALKKRVQELKDEVADLQYLKYGHSIMRIKSGSYRYPDGFLEVKYLEGNEMQVTFRPDTPNATPRKLLSIHLNDDDLTVQIDESYFGKGHFNHIFNTIGMEVGGGQFTFSANPEEK